MKMLPSISDPDLLVSIDMADDAGVYKLTDDIALVQTVDVVTPMVDDPYAFGQIAAANSLSDVYAMGGKPVTALNITGFPKDVLELEIVAEILKGAIDKTREAECLIVGGHTINDDELKFGLSVTGIIHPDRIVRNSGAQPGDKLILTKPLGMGILSTALKAGKLGEESITKITRLMSELNKTSSELMHIFKAHAATDISGFGLLGHAFEIARGSNVSMKLYAGKIPYLPETMIKTKEAGYIPGGSVNNKKYLQEYVTFEETVDEQLQMIFFDAQTSGGLLIAVPPEAAEDFLVSLHENGVSDAEIIGEVIDLRPPGITVT